MAFFIGRESSLSLDGGPSDGSCTVAFMLVVLPPTGTDVEKSLGIGRAEGAGDAWNVGPAYAWTGGVLLKSMGVVRLDAPCSGRRAR